MTLNCFSQIDTVKNKVIVSDTTKVILSKEMAKEIVKDLIRLDGCQEELNLCHEQIKLMENREVVKDSIIQLLKINDTNNVNIMTLKDSQLKLYEKLTDDLKKEIRQKKTENIFLKIGSVIGIISTSILIGIWH